MAELKSGRSVKSEVTVISQNFAYVWLPDAEFPASRFPPPNIRGLWIRVPVTFPAAYPNGVVTLEKIAPLDGHAIEGYRAAHPLVKPVFSQGGQHYYSWSWSKKHLGTNPPLNRAEDILEVTKWVERLIRTL